MMRGFRVAVWLAVAGAGAAGAYPLDGYESTGIARLEAFDLAREPLLARGTLKPGSLLTLEEVDLRLQEWSDFTLPDLDPKLSSQIQTLLGGDAAGYGIAILDITDPAAPRYAEHNGSMIQNPGSVGKLAVALAFFQGLADAHPDVETRRKILTETQLAANGFIHNDHHVVPFWKPGDPTVKRRPIEEGDTANLYTWLDWMASASSNAAASMVMSQVMLLEHFGSEYPVSDEVAAEFFANTPKKELTKIYMDALISPLGRNGLDSGQLRQGSFFTREGKKRVSGTNSVANARELMRYLVLMEQGVLVDAWSSREIKRLIYLTDIRIRYAASPALKDAAVYFKSGSLYGCKEEPGFECGKYIGNRINYMNSVAIVETVMDGRPLRYMVVLLSNVLRKNSAAKHQQLAAEFQDIIEGFHRVPAPASDPAEADATTSER